MGPNTLKLVLVCLTPLVFVVLMGVTICVVRRTFQGGGGVPREQLISEMGKGGVLKGVRVLINLEPILVIQPDDPPELGMKEPVAVVIEGSTTAKSSG